MSLSELFMVFLMLVVLSGAASCGIHAGWKVGGKMGEIWSDSIEPKE